MQYRYFKNRYLADILWYYWDKYFREGEDDVNERFTDIYKSKSPLLGKLKSLGVNLGYGRLERVEPSGGKLFRIYDTRGTFKFFAYGKTYYTEMAQSKAETEVLDKSDIDKMFNRIGENMLDEITDRSEEGWNLAKGMSNDASGLLCGYELEYGAAFAFCRRIFKNGSSENKFTLNNYIRDKYEEYNALANEALLEIVDIMYKSITADGKIAVGNGFNIRNNGGYWILSGENCGFMEYEYNEIITSIEPINSEKTDTKKKIKKNR